MTPCPLCLHRAHQPGKCATPSIDGCTCGMTRRQQRGHHRRLRIAEQLENLAERIRYRGRP